MKKLAILLASLVMISATISVVSAYSEEYYGMSEEDAMGLAMLGGTMGIVCSLLSLIINILIMVFLYKDAEKRGKSGILWAILGFFLSIIALIIWLLVRPPIGAAPAGGGGAGDRRCPNCGRNMPVDARVCPYCGKNFDQ